MSGIQNIIDKENTIYERNVKRKKYSSAYKGKQKMKSETV